MLVSSSHVARLLLLLALCCLASRTCQADSAPAGAFATPVTVGNIDAAAWAQFVDGVEQPLPSDKPTDALWTTSTSTRWNGVHFGVSKSVGFRALRVGFMKPISVGTILMRGVAKVSVLKPTAAYPGRLNDEDDWVPAQRILGGSVSTDETGPNDYAVWVLPAGTSTRALRFGHTALATDARYDGSLSGAYVLSERYTNVAVAANVLASVNGNIASRVVREKIESFWDMWENGDRDSVKLLPAISASAPVDVTLQWSASRNVSGLCGFMVGFGAADIQVYTGDLSKDPREASPTDWRTIESLTGIHSGYPYEMKPVWIDFGETLRTKAIRVRITGVTAEDHPHLNGATVDGHRIWLANLMALSPLDSATLDSSLTAAATSTLHPPIPLHFTLKQPSYVTLAIDNAQGQRVRNLVSDTPYPAGDNVAWWDATDDLLRDRDAANHGLYHIPQSYVSPGTYTVHGLAHPKIDLKYELCVNSSGTPPWHTADGTGGWMTTHTPPQAALFVPAEASPTGKPLVYIGCYIAEGGSGLIWLDENGHKQGGRTWVGGNWTSAPFLARDSGKGVPGEYAYVAAAWKEDRTGTAAEIRLTALSAKGDRQIPALPIQVPAKDVVSGTGLEDVSDCIGGLAARDGLIAVSLGALNAIQVVDAATGKLLGHLEATRPQGVAIDSAGALLYLTGKNLMRYAGDLRNATSLDGARALILNELDNPRGITLDGAGNIYISEWGTSHQVKVFSASGKFLRTVGHAGLPMAGVYDPLHMNHPLGVTVDSANHLWVTEKDFQPKRVSEWDQTGKLLNAFYGPARYGGGGTLDSKDKSLFYYDGMAFKIDWATGASVPSRIYWREDEQRQQLPGAPPELALYAHGAQYFTNSFNSNPTNGASISVLFRCVNGIAVPCAALGRANDWPLLKTAEFRGNWPTALDPSGDMWKNQAYFVWSDLNGDGIVTPNEVTIRAGSLGGVTVMPDLTMVASRIDDHIVSFAPTQFTAKGVPVYRLDSAKALIGGAQKPTTSGGDQVLLSPDGWAIANPATKPYSPLGLAGLKNGVPMWSYPSVWPGLHASHSAGKPTFPGELIGTTRFLGNFVTPRTGDAGPLWSVNGNMGDMYLFTEDGLFVTQLFQDIRVGKPWSMPVAQRGMLLNDVSLHDENFFPTIDQTAEGAIYLVDGARNAVVSVSGLDSIERLPLHQFTVTAKDIADSHAYFVQAEIERQQQLGTGVLNVPIVDVPFAANGPLDKWPVREWAIVDRRGTAANFNSNSKPYDITAAMVVSGDKLYAAWRTNDANLLANSANEPNAMFKTGGALDLQIETSPGGERLLVTRKDNQTWAMLYRARVPGTTNPIPFSSPWRTITIDSVEDVSVKVQLTVLGDGNFVLTVPLDLLGLKPASGTTLRGDIGILRGDGAQTLQRAYWNNKATAITSDVPSEAELTPNLWGKFVFGK